MRFAPALALTLLAACGPGTIIQVLPPLTVVDTFPGNGTTLPGANVKHIDIVFSDRVDGALALSEIRLAAVSEGDEVLVQYDLVADEDKGEGGFDVGRLTLSALIGDPSLDGSLPDGNAYRVLISAGLKATSGSVLPADVVHRFATRDLGP